MEPLEPWRIVTQLIAAPLLIGYCLIRRRTDLLIIAACIGAMTAYGMLQDQFSVRLSREYFTVGHPTIEGLNDPTLLGLAWGFLGGGWATAIPESRHLLFFTVACAHFGTYLTAVGGTAVLCLWTIRLRRRLTTAGSSRLATTTWPM